MGRLTALLAVAATASTAAACGEDRFTTTGTTRVPAATDTLVVCERTGGEEGVRERLEVRPDGTARVTDRDREARVRLSPEELEAVRAVREAVDLGRLRVRYGMVPAPLDAYVTTLTADGRRVRIIGDPEVPPPLDRLRAACTSLIERHRPR